ncbi:MAG: metallophosphoesterase, partial [Sedimentisphaerales bacterium]
MKKLSITVKVKAITGLLCLLGLAMLVASANAQPFHFTITSDQRGGTDAMQPFGSRTFQAIKDKVGGPGAFHVLCGDIDYAATNPSNRTLIDTYFGSNFPCYGVVGNHDAESPTTDMQWLRDEYNNGHSVRTPLQTLINRPGPTGSVETTYSWDYGNAHFIVLNCYWDGNTIANSDSDHGLIHGDASGDIKPALLTWLTNDLAATSKPFIFIFVHEPAFPYNHHYGDSLDKYPTDRDAFWSLLESHKVSAVFVGHTHYYYKHQGDKRGWTYDYPTINSWRTQDPNMAGKYGRVWEISTGNAGWTPGGVTAGPTQNDYLPTNLQWNGLEFIDVNVTEDFATVNVYRDIRPLSDSNTGLNFTLADTISINGDFLAYNDCVFDPCLVDVNTDPFGNKVAYGDLAHITNYGTGTPSSDHQSSYVFPTSGKLKDYTTGADTGVTCTMTQSGGVTWQPMVGSVSGTNWSGGYDTAPGTDAYSTFHGIADMTGVIYYGTASGWWVDANFTGLNPNKTYTFATSAARSKSTTDGAPGYLDRWTIYTISGIDSATNASTAGTTEYLGDPLRVRFNTGNNHNEGYVARWTGITPGADGKFKVRAEASPDSNDPAIRKAYAFSVFMLREEPMSPDHTPPTPNPMTWASAPTATGATSITMTANTATDANYPPVQYYFECTTDSNKSSTWQISPTYAPTGLTPSTLYTFRVKARDAAPVPNETGWSTEQSATTPQPPPGAATNPSPSTGATGIAITTDLSWTAGSNATSHDVYFGTATTPPLASSSQAGTTFDTGTMSYNTTYYWRIDEKNAGGTTTGTVWHFTTAAQSLPTFVAAGTVAYNTNAITPALPSGIAAGDILLLFLETANQAITIPTPNGGTWTEVTSSPQGTGTAGNTSATRLTVFWSRFNGTQGAPTTSDSGDHQLGRIIAVRGAATSGNPWNITGGGVEATADTSGSIPGATTTVNNTLIVAAIAAALPDSNGTNDFSAWTNSNLTSIAERTDDTTGQGNGGGLGVATGGRAATGAYGSTAVTLATSAYKGMMSIAIKPGMTPGQATNPTPINGATSVSLTQDLSWSAGSGATSRDVYFGTVNPPVTKVIADGTALTYDTGTMVNNKTYYWRVDEKNADGTTTGMIWSFTTIPLPPGAATTPSPADTAINVGTTTDLGWTAGSGATSHDVYFGTATSPPLVCGGQAGTTFDTGTMATSTTYYWRVDEKNAGGTTTGTVWSFTTVPPPPGA